LCAKIGFFRRLFGSAKYTGPAWKMATANYCSAIGLAGTGGTAPAGRFFRKVGPGNQIARRFGRELRNSTYAFLKRTARG
jgi:hypothetical protein